MKQTILFFILILTFYFSNGQGGKALTCADFSGWPCGFPAKQTFAFNPKSPDSSYSIVLKNIDSLSFIKLLDSSTAAGTYNGKPLALTKLSSFAISNTSLFKIDVKGKQCTIVLAGIFSDFKSGDSLVLSLKKDTITGHTIAMTFILSAAAPAPAPAQPNTSTVAGPPIIPQSDLWSYFYKTYPKMKKTDVGYKMPDSFYVIHIFLDQFGTSLFGSIPTGIQRKYHYLIHVLYAHSEDATYSFEINSTSGTLSDQQVIYNSGVTVPAQQNLGSPKYDTAAVSTGIDDIAFNLFPTSDDLVFELDQRTYDSAKKVSSATKIQSYTIKKSPYYSGSFNLGIVYTYVANPTYQLVNSPTTTGSQTVKATDNNGGPMATFLYTIYWSPVNQILPNGKDGVKYSSWGRSYLDEQGSLIRYIYPCIGFGLKDQVFTNIIAGLDFEPFQGFGFFLGGNVRKVNTFDMPAFVAGTTVVTQDQFNYYQNTKWKSGWSGGIEIDLSVFAKIVTSLSSQNGKN